MKMKSSNDEMQHKDEKLIEPGILTLRSLSMRTRYLGESLVDLTSGPWRSKTETLNVCSGCQDGSPAVGDACAEDGGHTCASCNPGYELMESNECKAITPVSTFLMALRRRKSTSTC